MSRRGAAVVWPVAGARGVVWPECSGGCGAVMSIVPIWYDPATMEATCARCADPAGSAPKR